MIGYWLDNIVRPSVRPSVYLSVTSCNVTVHRLHPTAKVHMENRTWT